MLLEMLDTLHKVLFKIKLALQKKVFDIFGIFIWYF